MHAIHLTIVAKYYLLECAEKFGDLGWLGDVMSGVVGWDNMGDMGGRMGEKVEGKCKRLLGVEGK